MNRKFLFVTIVASWICISALVSCYRTGAAVNYSARNINTGIVYQTIQSAIDDSQTLVGHTIYVKEGTYFEHVTVHKSLSLVGEQRLTTIINGSGAIVFHVTANKVAIKNFTVLSGYMGVFLDRVNDTSITENVMVGNDQFAVYAYYSRNCTIESNNVANTTGSGILVTNSQDFAVCDNDVYGSGQYGINANASVNGLFRRNFSHSNFFDGIGLGMSSYFCNISENVMADNRFFGLWLDYGSENNTICQNDFINNGKDVVTVGLNDWDNGFEGNYWSKYSGYDSTYDGIGDAPYGITYPSGVTGPKQFDRYPLMGLFSSFDAYRERRIDVISNSTITRFMFVKSNTTFSLRFSHETANQTFEFCRIRIPYTLMVEPYTIFADGDMSRAELALHNDGASRWLYFSYNVSLNELTIKGTKPVDIDPPMILVISPSSQTFATDSVSLVFALDEEASWIGYSLDGRSNVTISGNTTLSNLYNGTHFVLVYANDTVGNMGYSETVYFVATVEGGLPITSLIIGVAGVASIIVVATFYYRRIRKAKKSIEKEVKPS